MQIRYTAMPTEIARAYQTGAPDAYGNPPERQIADDGGYQCRHCLTIIPPGDEMLLVAYRPFEALDAYAETGPVFVCAKACEGFGTRAETPATLQASPDFLLKGYGANDRIVYGTGAVTEAADVANRAAEVFANPDVAYIHVRSSRNNCYQARIDRG
ncbi:DUF1203 domain-containing protein [uncultured Roseovarius sp.]|uniref:DUF1203 domain-containing protein n=1 Tax=uncultured Roseovarius sp. TaxID=293344 RepID=UPI002622308A|nr:DUF1203 domain-containing protein [uncultured Roseovarius sp.]